MPRTHAFVVCGMIYHLTSKRGYFGHFSASFSIDCAAVLFLPPKVTFLAGGSPAHPLAKFLAKFFNALFISLHYFRCIGRRWGFSSHPFVAHLITNCHDECLRRDLLDHCRLLMVCVCRLLSTHRYSKKSLQPAHFGPV